MTHEEREALRGLCEEATSGPWIASSSCDGEVVYRIRNGDYYPIIAAERAVDAAFIAAARTALPELLEENETLFAEKLDLLSQLELMRLRAEKAEKENLSRELSSFEEHRDLHYWRDEARKYKARAEAAEARAEAQEAERDAAIADLKAYGKNVHTCVYSLVCQYVKTDHAACCDCTEWEWRGQEGGERDGAHKKG